MLSHPLMSVLRDPETKAPGLTLDAERQELVASSGRRYPMARGVPSLLLGGAEVHDWNVWDQQEHQRTGHSYYRRATGELPEKEASKSYANLMKRRGLYQPGDTLLDIGCATGFFSNSFRRILDPDIRYTGIDITRQFLEWGAEIYGIDDRTSFVHADALNLPFIDDSFDTVVVNLFHFFPDIVAALREVMRVAGKRVIWRTPIGQCNYAVKMFYESDLAAQGVLTAERTDIPYEVYMLYAIPYIEQVVAHLGGRVDFIERDTDFAAFDNTALPEFEAMPSVPATKVVNGQQVHGNLILDWQYVAIDCSGVR